MASEPKTTLLLKLLILTSNTRATKQSQVFKLRIYGKGIQCHSNHSLQLFELKKKKSNKIKSRYETFSL